MIREKSYATRRIKNEDDKYHDNKVARPFCYGQARNDNDEFSRCYDCNYLQKCIKNTTK